MKRWAAWLLALLLLLPPSALAEETPRLGMLIYNGTDAFMSDVFGRILKDAQGVAEVTFLDSRNSQIVQVDQVEQLLKAGADALIVNAVDRTAAVYLIRMIQPYGVPVVFINREPLREDLELYDKAYYVGNNPKRAGALSGQLVAEYFANHPEADRNKDGVIQYILLKGEPGHQDTELRSQYAIKALQEAGFATEKLAEESAMWMRAIAQDKMAGFLADFGDRLECVLCNNDEMALGAIEALKAAGYFTQGRFLPVVGVDATAQALEALEEGTLLGTVLNDPYGLSDAALRLALLLAQGLTPEEAGFPYPLDQGVYIWTDSRKVTQNGFE